MPLTLVLGRARAGKTEYCLSEMLRLAQAGTRCVLIVPEQSSFAAEREVSLRFEGALGGLVEVKSLKRICSDLFARCGGVARERVSEAARASLVRRAIVSLGSEIRCYRRHRRDRSFYTMVSEVIGELKNAAVPPSLLRQAAGDAANGLTSQKLQELALIYERYESLLGTSRLDIAGELEAAVPLVAKSGLFRDVTIFVDDFSGFTEPQCHLLAALLSAAREVVCSLCLDSLDASPDGPFGLTLATARRLISLAARAGDSHRVVTLHPFADANAAAPTVTMQATAAQKHPTDPDDASEAAPVPLLSGAAALDRYLTTGRTTDRPAGVYYSQAAGLYDEVRLVAAEIVALTRSGAFSPEDIAVLSRDAERYRPAVEQIFPDYDIPWFSDQNTNLSCSPVVAFVQAALGLAGNLSTDHILALLKTGLTRIPSETTAQLQNYCFVWDIDGGGWYTPFDRSPQGYGQPGDADRDTLAALECARVDLMSWLRPFLRDADGATGGELISCCFDLLVRCGGLTSLEQQGTDAIREGNLSFSVLDQLHGIVGDEDISPAELSELLTILATATPMGELPLTNGLVTVGDAVRTRTDSPRVVFVMGLNEGIFPAVAGDPPLLTHKERELLAEWGAELPRSFANTDRTERFTLYRALTCASERVYLSCARTGAAGESLDPSAELTALVEALFPAPFDTADDPLAHIVNHATVLTAYAEARAEGIDPFAQALSCAFPEVCAPADRAAAQPVHSLSPDLALQLLGHSTTLSSTRFESYEQCPFSYFMRYMMRIRPLERARISPVEAGSLVHAVVEGAMRAFDGDLREVTDHRLSEAAGKAADSYLTEHLGDELRRPRIRYLTERLVEQSGRLLRHLREEQRQSQFLPRDFELGIGTHADIPPLRLMTEQGYPVAVEGKVDRVDTFTAPDGSVYLRVVDYKTGDKAFRLADVYHGLGIQMLLYLFAVCDSDRYGDAVPSGVLYLPSDPRVPDALSSDDEAAKKVYRMDGLILDDPDVIRAMEQDIGGLFIPVRQTSGGIGHSEKLASLEKFGRIRAHIEGLVADMASALYAGRISPCPAAERGDDPFPCRWCGYAAVCRRDRVTDERRLTDTKDPFEEVMT